MHTKNIAKNVLIAGGAGAVGLFAGGFANQKSATLQKYPYAVPLLLLLLGGVVLAKSKSALGLAAGLGVAGGGGVLGLMQYQAQKMAEQSKTAAGVGDAGKYGRIGPDGRWHRSAGELGRSEGGAGSLQGRQAQRLLAQQETMGVGDAGSLQGRGRRSVIDAQGLSDI